MVGPGPNNSGMVPDLVPKCVNVGDGPFIEIVIRAEIQGGGCVDRFHKMKYGSVRDIHGLIEGLRC